MFRNIILLRNIFQKTMHNFLGASVEWAYYKLLHTQINMYSKFERPISKHESNKKYKNIIVISNLGHITLDPQYVMRKV